jgi:hypothetical protein
VRDRIAERWSTTMTHAGDFLGIPATGRRVTLKGLCIVGLFEQIGSFPAHEAVAS